MLRHKLVQTQSVHSGRYPIIPAQTAELHLMLQATLGYDKVDHTNITWPALKSRNRLYMYKGSHTHV